MRALPRFPIAMGINGVLVAGGDSVVEQAAFCRPHAVPLLDAAEAVLGVVGLRAGLYRFTKSRACGVVVYVNSLVGGSGKGK